MKSSISRVFLAATLGVMPFGCQRSPTPVPRTEPSMAVVLAKGLEGDLKTGLELLDRIPPGSLNKADQAICDCLQNRFKQGQDPELGIQTPLARDIAKIYVDYWRDCLLKRQPLEASNTKLFLDLVACLDKHGKNGSRMTSPEELSEALGPVFSAEGLHSLRGMTGPYAELMLWRKEESRTYQVDLPDSKESLKVVFISGFILKGWSAFATCDKSRTGGWTTSEAIYCLEESYDLKSENFRVSLLAHEGQHFSDNKRFPKLAQPELEYRAKLVEIINAQETLFDLLKQFTIQSGKDRSTPHPFANRCLVEQLSIRLFGDDSPIKNPALWSKQDHRRIHRAALDLFKANTQELEKAGADRAERVL